MKLSAGELEWVTGRINALNITYAEFYNELTDHIITAIEVARANGDRRAIEVVFDEVIATQFSGEKAIAKIQMKYVFAYDCKIRRVMWANMRYYFNAPAILVFAIIFVITVFYLPHSRITAFVMLLLLLLIAVTPQFYVIKKLPKIKLSRQKTSMVRSFIVSRSRNLMLLSIINFNIIAFVGREYHIGFLNPLNYNPVVYPVLLCCYVLYSLSCMRLCRQELKLGEF